MHHSLNEWALAPQIDFAENFGVLCSATTMLPASLEVHAGYYGLPMTKLKEDRARVSCMNSRLKSF